jgi:hypothetical protein
VGRNHDDSTDETPEKVELAPGKYTIWAQSDKDGYVNIASRRSSWLGQLRFTLKANADKKQTTIPVKAFLPSDTKSANEA